MGEKFEKIALENKTVAITGGYGYLGEGIALSMEAHGANVYVLGRDKAKFDEKFASTSIQFQQCDISSEESIVNALKTIYDTEGQIDAMVNNAFYLSPSTNQETISEESWSGGIDGSLNSVHRCIKAVIPYLKTTKGKIINVASMYGIVAPDMELYSDCPEHTNPAVYGVAKAGVIQMTKYYSSLLGKYEINVNSVSPGPFPNVNTQMNQDFVRKLELKTSLNRIGSQRDIGGAFVFLASNASDFITGHNLVVDGGWTVK